MATGKELVRMMSCGIWEKWIANKEYYCSSQIFNDAGKPITKKIAETKAFCHTRILLKGQNLLDEFVDLLGEMLRMVASTRSESMCLSIHQTYGFYEIIIS